MSDNECISIVLENVISGKWAGCFVWADDLCVVFVTVESTAPGHVLVIPRHIYEKWTDAPASVVAHLVEIAHTIGTVQEKNFDVPRSDPVITDFEVPHTRLHVIPLRSEADVLLSNAAPASDGALDETMDKLREGLHAAGYGANVPLKMNSPTLARTPLSGLA